MTDTVNVIEGIAEPDIKYTKEIFDAIGIKSVFWVDDQFRENKKDSHQEQECIAHLVALLQVGNLEGINTLIQNVLSDQEFHVDDHTPVKVLHDYFEEKITDENIELIVQHLGIKSDLSSDNFALLREVLNNTGVKLQTLSWSEWNKDKSKLTHENNSFFMIDHDFSDESEAVGNGSDIIESLTKEITDSSYCFLLTHEPITGDQEDDLRKTIIQEKKLDDAAQVKFSVVSKTNLDFENKDTVDHNFGEITKSVYLRRVNVNVFDAIKDQIYIQLSELRNDLCQSSAFEIEQVVFNRTRKEGSSEIDLLRRFINIKSDQALLDTIKDTSFIDMLKQIRGIQSIQISNNQTQLSKNSSSKNFSQYRKIELFDDFVNLINSPLSFGDIFELDEGETKSTFILIAQDCDLILRDNGVRKCTEVILVPFSKKEKNLPLSPSKRKEFSETSIDKYILLLPDEITASKLEFDFTKAIAVTTETLDLCVFNTNGDLKIDLTQSGDFFNFLPGWKSKFDSIKKCVSNLQTDKTQNTFPHFTLTSRQPQWFTESVFGVSGKRVKRLKSPFKNELLHKYFAYKSRIAFDHDFTTT